MQYNLCKRQRSPCAELRSGTFLLALETGRFNTFPEKDSLCLCELGDIENGIHLMFLLSCRLHEDLRGVLYSEMSSIWNDFFWPGDYEKLELCIKK